MAGHVGPEYPTRPQGGTPAMVLLLTETGYSMLVKSFTDDLAWEVQRQLVRSYFKQTRAAIAAPDFSDPIAMARAWADAKQAERDEAARAAQLEHQVEELVPAAAGFERIAGASGSLCITDAAKNLQTGPKRLIDLLLQQKWIYARPGKRGYLAYQDKIQAGHLTHKQSVYEDPKTYEQKVSDQVRVTPRGLTKLALLLGAETGPPGPQAH
jgi:phage antirepressor YoqD-like protein